jgi:hypothetical protein
MTRIAITTDQLPSGGALPCYDVIGPKQPVFDWKTKRWIYQKGRRYSNAPILIGDKQSVISNICDAYLRLLKNRKTGTLLISWCQGNKYHVALTFYPKDSIEVSDGLPTWFPVRTLNKENAILLYVMGQ